MCITQQQRFERRVNDLREFRKMERDAVDALDARESEEEFNRANAHANMLKGAVQLAALELAKTYYED